MLDATCTPADIKYPTDIGILNEAREKTEKIIDKLYKEIKEKKKEKPRTYREKERKDYLTVAKKRRPSKKEKRKGIKKQLQYNIKRNWHWYRLARSYKRCNTRGSTNQANLE